MTIAVLGGGGVGSALAETWRERGHEVIVSTRDTIAETAAAGEVVVLALPAAAVPEALTTAGSLDGKILLDATNNLSGGPAGLEIAALAPDFAQAFEGARSALVAGAACFDALADPLFFLRQFFIEDGGLRRFCCCCSLRGEF